MAAYSQFDLTELQIKMIQRWDSTPFWTPTESQNAINEALLVWNSMTGFWKQTIEITTTPFSWDYALPESLVFGMRVEYEGKPLAESSLADMDNGHPGWQSQNTDSGGSVPTEPKKWLPLSIDMIAIWPADADGGHILTVDGVMATPILQFQDSFINIGEDELDVVLGYALHICALKEGGERFAATQQYFKDFLAAAAEENDLLTQSAMFKAFLGMNENYQTPPNRGMPTAYDKFSGRQP